MGCRAEGGGILGQDGGSRPETAAGAAQLPGQAHSPPAKPKPSICNWLLFFGFIVCLLPSPDRHLLTSSNSPSTLGSGFCSHPCFTVRRPRHSLGWLPEVTEGRIHIRSSSELCSQPTLP